jgi:hypothetical protein
MPESEDTPVSDDKTRARIWADLTPLEKRQLEVLAAAEGKSVSALVAELVRGKLKRTDLTALVAKLEQEEQ